MSTPTPHNPQGAPLIDRGAYAVGTPYFRGDVVLSGGALYVALAYTLGSAPPGSAWQSLGSGGGGSLELTDGTHDLTGVTKITVSGATVGGTSAAATLAPRQLLPWFNAKNYGAVGDGVTDDTTAIGLAVAAYNAAGGGVLYFPAPSSSYKTSGGFTLSAAGSVRGDGMADADGSTAGASTILCSSTMASLFTVTAGSVTFADLTLYCSGGIPTSGAGITVNGSSSNQRINFERISVYGFYINIDIQTGQASCLHNCLIVGPQVYGLRLQNTLLADAGGTLIEGCDFFAGAVNATAAIEILSGGGVRISNTTVVSSQSGTHFFTHAVEKVSSVATGVFLVNNCSFESCLGSAITITQSGGAWTKTVMSNLEIAYYSTPTADAIVVNAASIGQLDDLVISNVVAFCGPANSNHVISLTNINNAFITAIVNDGFSGRLAQSGCTNIIDLSGGGGSGTVTSVGLTLPAEFSVSGSPVTTAGSLTATKATQAANKVWAGPTSGGSAAPTFRSLVAADLPSGVGSGELLMQDGVTFPPAPLTTEDGADWVYQG